MRASLIAVVLLMAVPALAEAPKPAPGLAALGYYVGAWKGHGETKAGPLGKAGKLSSEQTCEWFTGKLQVVCRGEEHGPTGTRAFMAIKSFDQLARTYTEYSISNRGESEYDQGGAFTGNTMAWLVDQDAGGGKHAKYRYTEVRVSPVLYTYKAELSLDGGPWTVLASGEIKKVR